MRTLHRTLQSVPVRMEHGFATVRITHSDSKAYTKNAECITLPGNLVHQTRASADRQQIHTTAIYGEYGTYALAQDLEPPSLSLYQRLCEYATVTLT